MKKKNLFILVLSFTLIVLFTNVCYGADSDYIGLFASSDWNYAGSGLKEKLSKLDLTLTQKEFESAKSNSYINWRKIDKDTLESLYHYSKEYENLNYKEAIEKLEIPNGSNVYYLKKGTLTITDESGNVITKVPHYVKYCKTPSNSALPYMSSNSIDDIKKSSNDYINTDFWASASTWFGDANNGDYKNPDAVDEILNEFKDMINVVGTTVIVIATIVLGIKYIIGTVESQTSAKEGLITLLVACIFFFGWQSIERLLFPGNNFIFTDKGDASYKDMVGRLYSTFTYVAQFVVVGAIIYVGIKYIFAGASGRAELKGKSVYFIIGIILAFATANVLGFISDIINDTLPSETSSNAYINNIEYCVNATDDSIDVHL